jgi:hypothetical protein
VGSPRRNPGGRGEGSSKQREQYERLVGITSLTEFILCRRRSE